MKLLAGLGAVTVAGLLASCSSGATLDTGNPSPSSTKPSAGATVDSDAGALQHKVGRSALLGKPSSDMGYLRVRQTPEGTCAVLASSLDSWTQLQGFFWPKGFHVVNDGKDAQVRDAHGRWVADVGDFVYVRGTKLQESGTLHQRCLHKWGDELAVKQVSAPGTPFGASRRPVVALDCQGMPQVRPREMGLGCDGGLSASKLRFTSWSRRGATATGIASGACSVSDGFADVPVSLSFGRAAQLHGLLALHGLHMRYSGGDPCR